MGILVPAVMTYPRDGCETLVTPFYFPCRYVTDNLDGYPPSRIASPELNIISRGRVDSSAAIAQNQPHLSFVPGSEAQGV